MPPTIDSIDHIHLYVPDKRQAAAWFGEHLGFEIIEALLEWDKTDGPLTIGRGDIHLALFEKSEYIPTSALAFRCSGQEFLRWRHYLDEHRLLERCSDHAISWSLYFKDPFGHLHEITSYEVDMIGQQLRP